VMSVDLCVVYSSNNPSHVFQGTGIVELAYSFPQESGGG